jgi:hypothetical protein
LSAFEAPDGQGKVAAGFGWRLMAARQCGISAILQRQFRGKKFKLCDFGLTETAVRAWAGWRSGHLPASIAETGDYGDAATERCDVGADDVIEIGRGSGPVEARPGWADRGAELERRLAGAG